MRKILFVLALFFILVNSHGQIRKGSWLIGGSTNFSSSDNHIEDAATYKSTDFQISGGVGYFFINKLTAGLKPTFAYSRLKYGPDTQKYRALTLGPFVRYYFLPADKQVNIFAEGNYQHTTVKNDNFASSKQNTFSFLGGPVIFVNTIVGIEFTVGYTVVKYDGHKGNNEILQVGVGFQIHLERGD